MFNTTTNAKVLQILNDNDDSSRSDDDSSRSDNTADLYRDNTYGDSEITTTDTTEESLGTLSSDQNSSLDVTEETSVGNFSDGSSVNLSEHSEESSVNLSDDHSISDLIDDLINMGLGGDNQTGTEEAKLEEAKCLRTKK